MSKGFLDAVVGDARQQVESRCVKEVVSAGDIEHDLRLALEVRVPSCCAVTQVANCVFIFRIAKNLERQFHFRYTIERLILFCFQTGKTRSCMSRTIPPSPPHTHLHPQTTLQCQLTRPLNLAHGCKVSSGVHKHHSVTSHNWNSIMKMMLVHSF